MTSLKYSKKFKALLSEAENQFTSALNTKMPGKEEQADTLVSPAIEPTMTDKSQQEKAALTAKALEKVKQSLEVSDELQSILNKIDKINKDINANKWQLNDHGNTAYLPSKNAQIFKQNGYLCLSYNDKVELFQSVSKLHDFLRKHNIPLPQNIKLHEAVEESPFEKLLNKYNTKVKADIEANAETNINNLPLDNKQPIKTSKEEYIKAAKQEQPVEFFNNKLHIKNVNDNKWHPVKKEECAATVGGSIGSAVQYTGKKLDEEDLQEVTPASRGWKPGITVNKYGEWLHAGDPDPNKPEEHDWTKIEMRGDSIAPLWFKWVSYSMKGAPIQFLPDKDANFYANAENYIKFKHGSTARSQLETSSWRDFWHKDNKVDLDPWNTITDPNNPYDEKKVPNPHYGLLNISKDELAAIAKEFSDKGYGDLLNGLDINDPDIMKKFHPLDIERPSGGFVLPEEDPRNIKGGLLYRSTINPKVREVWYDSKEKRKRVTPTDQLVSYLAKNNNQEGETYRKNIVTDDRFKGLRTHNQKDWLVKDKDTNSSDQSDKIQRLYNTTVRNLSDPNYPADKVLAGLQATSKEFSENPALWNKMIDQLILDADMIDEIDLSDENLEALKNRLKLKTENTSIGNTFLDMMKNDDVPLKEDDSPADFASGQSAIASDISSAIDTASGTANLTADTANNGTMDYTAADGTIPDTGATQGVNFDDININRGGGDYSPDITDPNAVAPLQNQPDYKIVDILVDENDPAKIKVKVKNLDTEQIETKDLNEIDV